MTAAEVPNRLYRDSVDSLNPASSLQSSSHSWTAVQILTPILVAFLLSLSFFLYHQYKKGRLSRLTSILFMRGRRQDRRPRGWTIDSSRLADRAFDLTPDAEATPMINPPHHWNSPRNTTDRLSPRIMERMMTISTAIRSIRRMFGGGPIPVSRAPVSDDFDIEDSDAETDPFGTLRSNASSRARRNGRRTSEVDREAPTQNPVQSSVARPDPTTLNLDLDDVRAYDGDETNVVGDGGVDDHDSKMVTGDSVMLISRNGQNFSLTGSVISMGVRGSPIDVDRSSIEVVPPTPTMNSRPFRIGAYHARSASTPSLHYPTPHTIPLRSFSPGIDDLSGSHSHRSPRLPVVSPIPISARPGASSSWQSRAEAHYYTAATPPLDPAGSITYRSPKMANALSLSPGTSPEQRSRRRLADVSPPVSPHLQNYAPSFRDSPCVPPSSVPSNRMILTTDPQNLIPSAVRGAGYNPFQHSQSTSDLAFE